MADEFDIYIMKRKLDRAEKELAEIKEENKVLMSECDRLIKEKGELLKKSEQIAEYKRLLKAAVEDIKRYAGGMCRVCTECTTDFECKCEDFCATSKMSKWKYKYELEILALIGEDGEQNG